MTFSIAHCDSGDGSYVFYYVREHIIEHTYDKCHVFRILYVRGRYAQAYGCQVSFVYTLVNL